MSLLRRIIGRRGEDRAAQYLRRRGYRILARNWRCRLGEIDLIALDGNTLVFVEVKTRRGETFGPPELAVTPRKQRQLTKAALSFIMSRKLGHLPGRFDVVAIRQTAQGEEITYLPGAFEVTPPVG
ncbi:MAG: YraN family protein [Nitrospirae bacterium]|nr:YraN family protein [Nitrospirota bacterium]